MAVVVCFSSHISLMTYLPVFNFCLFVSWFCLVFICFAFCCLCFVVCVWLPILVLFCRQTRRGKSKDKVYLFSFIRVLQVATTCPGLFPLVHLCDIRHDSYARCVPKFVPLSPHIAHARPSTLSFAFNDHTPCLVVFLSFVLLVVVGKADTAAKVMVCVGCVRCSFSHVHVHASSHTS